jgi:hypothetical protein
MDPIVGQEEDARQQPHSWTLSIFSEKRGDEVLDNAGEQTRRDDGTKPGQKRCPQRLGIQAGLAEFFATSTGGVEHFPEQSLHTEGFSVSIGSDAFKRDRNPKARTGTLPGNDLD